jgi:hypothetical protein
MGGRPVVWSATVRVGRFRVAWPETALRPVVAVAILLGVGAVGSSVQRQLWEAAQLATYRSSMRELCEVIRTMRWQTTSGRRTLELHSAPERRSFQLVAVDGRGRSVQRTIWLPEGLEILESTQRVVARPGGRLTPGAIVVSIPSHHRLFRLTITGRGFVECHEEQVL